MKTRIGFVSNSSTTSFVIYGVQVKLTDALYEKFLGKKEEPKKEVGCEHKFDREKAKYCPTCGSESWVEEEQEEYYYDDIVEFFEYKYNLDCSAGVEYDDGGIYIGRDIEASDDKDLKLEKLMEVRKTLNELFPKKTVTFYSGCSGG